MRPIDQVLGQMGHLRPENDANGCQRKPNCSEILLRQMEILNLEMVILIANVRNNLGHP